MLNPKWQCAYPEEKRIVFGGKFLTQWPGYSLSLQQTSGGTISADKSRAYYNDIINLSYTANQDYYFNGWQTTGSNANGNQIKMNQDTTANGSFVYSNPYKVQHRIYNQAANTERFYFVQGGNAVPVLDVIKEAPLSSNGFSSDAMNYSFLKNVFAVHYKFKTVPITLNNYNYCYAFETLGHAGELYWSDNGWTEYTTGPALLPRLMHVEKHFPKLSANRFPMMMFYLYKSKSVNTAQAEEISSGVYAKCTNWTTGWNDLKYLVNIVTGGKMDYNYNRTCFVSAYYNNNYICSAWQGLYNVNYDRFNVSMGVFSATSSTTTSGYKLNSETRRNTYTIYNPVAGSSYLDVGNFTNVNVAKHWLDSL